MPFTLLGLWHLTLTNTFCISITCILLTLLRLQHPALAAATITPQYTVFFFIFPGPDTLPHGCHLYPARVLKLHTVLHSFFFIPLAALRPIHLTLHAPLYHVWINSSLFPGFDTLHWVITTTASMHRLWYPIPCCRDVILLIFVTLHSGLLHNPHRLTLLGTTC